MPDQALLEGALPGAARAARAGDPPARLRPGQGRPPQHPQGHLDRVRRLPALHAGDDPRSVDWNIYRRSGNLFVKQFEEEEVLTAHLLVDVSRSMDWGSPSKLQFASRLAAALGYIVLAGSSRLVVTTLVWLDGHLVRAGLGPALGGRPDRVPPARAPARRDRPGRRAGQLRAPGRRGQAHPDQRPADPEVRAGHPPAAGPPLRGHRPARAGAGRGPPADERRPDADRPRDRQRGARSR